MSDFFNAHYEGSMCLIENFLLNLQVYKTWAVLYCRRRITFSLQFCLLWFQNQVSFQFVIGLTLRLCPQPLYVWLLLASVRVPLQRKAFFCQRFADNKCEGLKHVESEFLLFKRYKQTWTLGVWPRATAVNGKVSINFRRLWIRLASPIYSGM